MGQQMQFSMHPIQTLIRRDSEIKDFGALMAGMKVTVLYREDLSSKRASVIQIDGARNV